MNCCADDASEQTGGGVEGGGDGVEEVIGVSRWKSALRKLPPKSSSSHASTGCNRSPGDAASRSTGSGAEGRGTVQEGDAGDVGELGELDDLGEPCSDCDCRLKNADPLDIFERYSSDCSRSISAETHGVLRQLLFSWRDITLPIGRLQGRPLDGRGDVGTRGSWRRCSGSRGARGKDNVGRM